MISFITCKHNINDKYSNDNYHNDVKKISYLLLVCPKCKTVGLFHRHAVYSRYLFNSTEEYITIQRVRCESCGSTHALLPDIIIPYRYFSSPFVLRLFDLYLKNICQFHKSLVLLAFLIRRLKHLSTVINNIMRNV